MEYIVSAFLMTLEWYSGILLFDAFFERRYSAKKFWSIAIVVHVVMFVIANSFFDNAIVRPFFTFWLFLFMMLVLYGKSSPVLKGVLSAIWMALCIGGDLTILYCASTATGISSANLLSTPATGTIVPCISKLCLVFITALIKRLHPIKKSTQKIQVNKLLLLLVFPGISCSFMSLLLQIGYAHPEYGFTFFVGILGLTIANVFLFAIMDRLEKDAQLREETILRNQQAELQMEHLAALQTAYAIQRKATHDYNKHLSVLQTLLCERNFEKADEYLAEIVKQSPTRVLAVRSGHAILDALFNQKYLAATAANIDVQFSVNDLSGIRIKAEDLVVLLSNLLDNALEACTHVENKRAMQIEMTLLQGEIFLSVRNTSLPVKIKDNYIPSTKPNPSEHGYGLQNIKTILKMYHSEFVMQYKNGYFQFTAEIPNIPLS